MDVAAFMARYERILSTRGIPKMEFYKMCGFTDAAVSQWRRGKNTPSMKTIQAIADCLGVTAEYLLTGAEQEEKPLINDDEELTEYLEELKSRPEKRMLFSVTKNATKAQIEAIVKMIEEMQGN